MPSYFRCGGFNLGRTGLRTRKTREKKRRSIKEKQEPGERKRKVSKYMTKRGVGKDSSRYPSSASHDASFTDFIELKRETERNRMRRRNRLGNGDRRLIEHVAGSHRWWES